MPQLWRLKALVVAHVVSVRTEQDEILDPVVGADTAASLFGKLVVNDLRLAKGSPDVCGHDKAMLVNIGPRFWSHAGEIVVVGDVDEYVSRRSGDVLSAFPSWVVLPAALAYVRFRLVTLGFCSCLSSSVRILIASHKGGDPSTRFKGHLRAASIVSANERLRGVLATATQTRGHALNLGLSPDGL